MTNTSEGKKHRPNIKVAPLLVFPPRMIERDQLQPRTPRDYITRIPLSCRVGIAMHTNKKTTKQIALV